MGILFAFCCLFCSAASDFVFKLFSGKHQSKGMMTALVGIVSMVLLSFSISKDTFSESTLVWGILTGLFSIVANIILIEALSRISAGVGSTIYRLNLVPTTVGAWLILGETISWTKWLGIILAIVSICCFSFRRDPQNCQSKRDENIGLFLAITACLLRAALGLTCKIGLLNGANGNGIVFLIGACWTVVGLGYAYFKEKSRLSTNRSLLGFGLLSGILITGITFFLAASLKYGDASVVLPIEQMSFPLTFILSVIILKEPLTISKISTCAFAVISIILLTCL